jgi:hypothetical protein
MSKGKKLLFKSNVILPWVIMICIVFTLQIQCEQTGDEKPIGKDPIQKSLSPGDIIKLEIKFKKDLENKYFLYFIDCFKKNDIERFADKIYKKVNDKWINDKIIFYDLKGTKLTERQDFIDFWMEVKNNQGVTDLDFSVLSLRVIPVAVPEELPEPLDTIIATGHAVFTYHLIKDTGSKVTNSMGSGTYDAPHPRACEW